jgi:hypothetical protein
MKFLDDLFEMNDGYVLDFKDRTMTQFFAEELNVDIDDDACLEFGTSKAKRLRCYLNKVDLPTSIKLCAHCGSTARGVANCASERSG